MKLTKSKLKQIIKEVTLMVLESSEKEEERVKNILNKFTPEQQEELNKLLGAGQVANKLSVEDQILRYLEKWDDSREGYAYRRAIIDRAPNPPESPDDKMFNLLGGILKHGGIDAYFADQKAEKEEWRRKELERQADRRASGVSWSDIHPRSQALESYNELKLTKSKLKQIIKEEIKKTLQEDASKSFDIDGVKLVFRGWSTPYDQTFANFDIISNGKTHEAVEKIFAGFDQEHLANNLESYLWDLAEIDIDAAVIKPNLEELGIDPENTDEDTDSYRERDTGGY